MRGAAQHGLCLVYLQVKLKAPLLRNNSKKIKKLRKEGDKKYEMRLGKRYFCKITEEGSDRFDLRVFHKSMKNCLSNQFHKTIFFRKSTINLLDTLRSNSGGVVLPIAGMISEKATLLPQLNVFCFFLALANQNCCGGEFLFYNNNMSNFYLNNICHRNN